MADTKATALSAFTPVLTDIVYGVDDPGGTPVSGKVTLTSLRDLLQAQLTKATITAAANAEAIVSTGYSLTGANAQSLIDFSGTWNTTGTPTLVKFNVTDTASNAASLALDLQQSSTSRFRVRKDGALTINGNPATATTLADFQSNATSALSISYQGIVTFGHSASALNFQGIAGQNLKITKDTLNWNNDLYITRDAANTLALRNGANAQAFNVYNTYTDASNYETGFVKWVSNVLQIGTAKGGTGTARNIAIYRDGVAWLTIGSANIASAAAIVPTSNNLLDLGSSSASWRDVYCTRDIYISESTAPTGVADKAILFAQDNGAGKTQLMVQFGSGAAQQIAIEP